MSSASNAALLTTKEAQRLAADPGLSAFVAANAGAGKTRVLTDRAARLLLAGAPSSRILCITYTKAAAAEMAERLFGLLGKWALADDATLAASLEELEGCEAPARTAAELTTARRLFAKALETPGGLKIQTIHSFCESVLKRFPIEAGAPPGFSVLDESAATALANAAIDETAALFTDHAQLRAAFSRLGAIYTPEALRALIAGELGARQKLEDALAAAGGWSPLRAHLADALGVQPEASAARIIASAISAIDEEAMRRAEAALSASGGNPEKLCGRPIGRFLAAMSDAARWTTLRSLFLKTNGEPRPSFGTKKTAAIDGGVEATLKELQREFLIADEKIKAAEILADTSAFLEIIEYTGRAYERMKARRAGLDYDDLISRARELFRSADLDWVRFKLDQGLDHILLDEAQDTSPAQWNVIEGPLEEFFAGAGAREGSRSFFAVGDQKQSIYSFQGADAGLFKEKRENLGKRIAAVAPFANVPLTLSFRTVAPVLEFVDAVFADSEVLDGVGDEIPLSHAVNRLGAAGLVELWPLLPRPESTETKAWDAPIDSKPPSNPERRLALEVAGTISAWLDARETLVSQYRPVQAGDVMILVQSRGPLFHEMIRALTATGVPVAGADKIRLLEDAAVEDLLSFARCALLETDDLSLAETLKSPFFNVDEDGLFALAHNRKESLWRTLLARAEERPEWRAARDEIAAARSIGLHEGAFAFFSHLLENGEPSGRKKLSARLGRACAEPVMELLRQALDYELTNPRSLQGFLLWAEKYAGEIKRDMEQTSEAVRVMTVHGAKGLEAEIVFLLDAHRGPNLNKLGPLLYAPAAIGRVPVLSASKESDCEVVASARTFARRRAFDEYRRLLYVAATRAKDRLYICGLEHGRRSDQHSRTSSEKTWHALAEDAFKRLSTKVADPGETSWGGGIRRIECAQTSSMEIGKHVDGEIRTPARPDWLCAPAALEAAPFRLSPSQLTDEADVEARAPAFSPRRSSDAILRGRVLHRLLELLPEIPQAERRMAAALIAARHAPAAPDSDRDQWRREALAVIDAPAFAPVFAPGSRAEVAIAGTPKGARPGVIFAGRIDRLAVDERRVFIVDYKTNRPPPSEIEGVPQSYIAQLAAYRSLLQEIYPKREIVAALLWTYEARLMALPADMLDHAFARVLA